MVYLYRLWKINYVTKPFKKTDLIVTYKTKSCIQHLKPKYLTKERKKENLYRVYIYYTYIHIHIHIYKLTCPDCGKIYTGQTGRNVEKRYKEHLFSFRSNKITTLAGRLMTLWRSCISVERGHTWSP
jgi:hypothetical protein